jgi:hypothetical protein
MANCKSIVSSTIGRHFVFVEFRLTFYFWLWQIKFLKYGLPLAIGRTIFGALAYQHLYFYILTYIAVSRRVWRRINVGTTVDTSLKPTKIKLVHWHPYWTPRFPQGMMRQGWANLQTSPSISYLCSVISHIVWRLPKAAFYLIRFSCIFRDLAQL